MPDYYSIIASAVSRLPSNTDEARHAIYQRARTALRETLVTLDPAVSANEQAALDAAITTVEMDLLFRIMRRFVRDKAAPSPAGLSFVSKVSALVRGRKRSDPVCTARKKPAAHVRFWHKADMLVALRNVRFQG